MRAVHQMIDAKPSILEDPIVLRLFNQTALDGLPAPQRASIGGDCVTPRRA